jgi:hypothetical protein
VTTRPIVSSLGSKLLVASVVVVLGGCGAVEDERAPAWGYISPVIMQPNCATASCHNTASAAAGLDFSSNERGWNSLRTLKLPQRGMTAPKPRPMVTPFNPDQSRLVNMLRASGARRMPPDRPLAEADIVLVEQWILNGALND